MKKFFVIAALAFLMVACAPSTKEEYLEEYKEFIEEVSEKAKTYSETDWAEKTEEFERQEIVNKNSKEKFIFCDNCGAKLAQGDAFCSECGTPVLKNNCKNKAMKL